MRQTRLGRIRRAARWVGGAVLIFAVAIVCHACATNRAIKREVAGTPRDPKTGIVIGAEPIDLDPPASMDRPTTAVLMLHGFVGSRKDFADLGGLLAAQGYHVRLARLPGHGTDPRDFAKQTPESMLAGPRAELEALRKEYKAVYVVGFSMGGAIGTILTSEGAVDRLVLISPYYGVNYKWYYVLPAETWNGMLSWAIPYVTKSRGYVRVNREEAKDQIWSYHTVSTRGAAILMTLGRRARKPETLGAVTCPVLMVFSEGDEASSPWRGRQAFARIGSERKSELWFTAKSNHHILYDFDRDEAKAAIVKFVKES